MWYFSFSWWHIFSFKSFYARLKNIKGKK